MIGKSDSPQQGTGLGITPSAFMRQTRPDCYSDSRDASAYQLDRSSLEQWLDTLTARNQTHDFEVFCRKLCERTLCPNLKPSTGPEGGGDSKADTESIVTADEITALNYCGEPNAGRERWAFAFSAKKTWASKVRSDVEGLIATGRGYTRIICVTSQHARAKLRAQVEDELTKKHGVSIEILDRNWISDKVIDGDNRDLAVNYLGVGHEIPARQVGPVDFARRQELSDLEKALQDPGAYSGMESQRATDALVAAKLSRGLERPRIETDGRFSRAIRLADADGVFRQQLEARYERVWTAFYWFDDIDLLLQEYAAFEEMALPSDAARNLELLCNLLQNLFTLVMHGHRTPQQVELDARVTRLAQRLETLAAEVERPNNRLEATTSLLIIRVNLAMIARDKAELSSLWPQFSDVLRRAAGLGEYSADRLVRLIEVFGAIAGSDAGYGRLVEELAAFVGDRTGEGRSGQILLNRARQLGAEDHLDMIRLLGKAVQQLAKKEYVEDLVEASYLLASAYLSIGMLWAARVNAIFALASIVAEAEDDGYAPASIIPALLLIGWIDSELRHLPEALDTVRLVHGCSETLPLDEESKARVAARLEEFDLILGSQFLNYGSQDLSAVAGLPDFLGGLGLIHSQGALLYALGYGELLMDEATKADQAAVEEMREMFSTLASQPVGELDGRPLITNAKADHQEYATRVLGMQVVVTCAGSMASILAAEAILAGLEVFFATTLEQSSAAHVERFDIRLVEEAGCSPRFDINADGLTGVARWPEGTLPATFAMQAEVHEFLVTLSAVVFGTTCLTNDSLATIARLCEDEALSERMATVVMSGNSRNRAFNASLSRLSRWTDKAAEAYPPRVDRPTITRRTLDEPTDGPSDTVDFHTPTSHREIGVHSVIDLHLWGMAGWNGVLTGVMSRDAPPLIGLLFKDRNAARRIFQRWRDRFGDRDPDGEIHFALVRHLRDRPSSHYRVLITSGLTERDAADRRVMSVPARMQTMEPATDENLRRFLERYDHTQCYLLMPAVMGADGQPELLMDLAILKWNLPVRAAADIRKHDIEAMALGPD